MRIKMGGLGGSAGGGGEESKAESNMNPAPI